VYLKNMPILKHYFHNRNERLELGKKHSRLWRARQDLLMHFDWAMSRNDPIAKITSIGREIERMDNEMKQIQKEIELLD
jgi:hypothetical protein